MSTVASLALCMLKTCSRKFLQAEMQAISLLIDQLQIHSSHTKKLHSSKVNDLNRNLPRRTYV